MGVEMPIEDDDDVEIEVSPLSQKFEENGIEVDVLIYRIAGSSEGWALEVVDEEDASTVWDDLFQSDQEAFDTFMKEVAEEGLSGIISPEQTTIH